MSSAGTPSTRAITAAGNGPATSFSTSTASRPAIGAIRSRAAAATSGRSARIMGKAKVRARGVRRRVCAAPFDVSSELEKNSHAGPDVMPRRRRPSVSICRVRDSSSTVRN